jgi:hypothetical protein
MTAPQDVRPPFWPECQCRDDKHHKKQHHGHLHKAKLRCVFCHNPARHKSRHDQKPSDNPTEHGTSSSNSDLKNLAGNTQSSQLDDTDGFWNGQLDGDDALSFCYMHTQGAGILRVYTALGI